MPKINNATFYSSNSFVVVVVVFFRIFFFMFSSRFLPLFELSSSQLLIMFQFE